MLTLFRYVLFLGVLVGLAGNGAAAASAPCNIMAMQPHMAAMAGMPDCDMTASCPDCPSKHSKGSKGNCAMMVGCVAALAIKEPTLAPTALGVKPIGQFWPVATVLTGRSVVPEPEPPTLLG